MFGWFSYKGCLILVFVWLVVSCVECVIGSCCVVVMVIDLMNFVCGWFKEMCICD